MFHLDAVTVITVVLLQMVFSAAAAVAVSNVGCAIGIEGEACKPLPLRTVTT
jgi:hypothetical protein